jgi:anti-anti-sigma factor
MEVKRIESHGEVTVVALSGRLDFDGVSQAGANFVSAAAGPCRPAIVDLSEVDFIMSRGITLLTRCATALKQAGAIMVLLAPQPMVEDVIRNTSLDTVMPIAHSRAKADEIIREHLASNQGQ